MYDRLMIGAFVVNDLQYVMNYIYTYIIYICNIYIICNMYIYIYIYSVHMCVIVNIYNYVYT